MAVPIACFHLFSFPLARRLFHNAAAISPSSSFTGKRGCTMRRFPVLCMIFICAAVYTAAQMKIMHNTGNRLIVHPLLPVKLDDGDIAAAL